MEVLVIINLLGNQIPVELEKILTGNGSLSIQFRGCGSGYPDRKVNILGVNVPLL